MRKRGKSLLWAVMENTRRARRRSLRSRKPNGGLRRARRAAGTVLRHSLLPTGPCPLRWMLRRRLQKGDRCVRIQKRRPTSIVVGPSPGSYRHAASSPVDWAQPAQKPRRPPETKRNAAVFRTEVPNDGVHCTGRCALRVPTECVWRGIRCTNFPPDRGVGVGLRRDKRGVHKRDRRGPTIARDAHSYNRRVRSSRRSGLRPLRSRTRLAQPKSWQKGRGTMPPTMKTRTCRPGRQMSVNLGVVETRKRKPFA